MYSLLQARALAAEGRFAAALRILEANPVGSTDKTTAEVLRAEMLQQVGRPDAAHTLITSILKSKHLTPHDQGLCHFVLGRIATGEGRLDLARVHLQKAASVALTAGDHERAAWAQSRLLLIIADSSTPDAVGQLLAEVRVNATRSGSPSALAAIHLFLAEMEAKRSLLRRAHRHIEIALSALELTSNVWLQSVAEHIEATIQIVAAQFSDALRHAGCAVDLARESGQAVLYGSSLANFGHVLYLTGRFDEATKYYDQAADLFAVGSEHFSGVLDTLARIKLAQGNLQECDELLQRVTGAIKSDEDRSRYVYRHSLLTRAQLLSRQDHAQDASAVIERAIALAEATHDDWLLDSSRLVKADLLWRIGDLEGILDIIETVASRIETHPLDVDGQYERVVGCALLLQHDVVSANVHFQRARTIYQTLGHVPGMLELDRCLETAALHLQITDNLEGDSIVTAVRQLTLGEVAALVLSGDHVELMAKALLRLLEDSGCIDSGHIERTASEDLTRVRQVSKAFDGTVSRELILANSRNTVKVVVRLKRHAAAVDAFNAVRVIVRALHQLQLWKAEQEEVTALWPSEDLPAEGDRTIASGHMRELMVFAQRIARTNVNVLITGESGTGKEILARAIHTFSDRAKKPFIPFNCAAVPRDLMETQLFGHRRGAFTGAERDHAGIIRTARDGTLFLDEIGELSLDLQPKLLRFLESGEIAPLGEPSPINVNVRIVAATNRNLDDLVQEGRFREDLFYRLNVVRLNIKPLRERRDEIPGLVTGFVARAAEEFRKGHLEIAEETMERLILYRWPGNVRQLQNELRRIVALAEPGTTILPDAIADDILAALPMPRPAPKQPELAVPLHDKLHPTLARIETEMIKAALREHHGRVEAVAKALGISRKGLYLKRQRLGL